MSKADTDNIWSCRKIWFHSLISLNHLWPWRPKSRLGSTHAVCGGNAAAASEQKSELMSKQLQPQRLLLHSESNGLKNILQSVRALQLKCCWVPPPLSEEISFGQRTKSFSPMAAQWRTLTICVIIEDRNETPLTIESHFDIRGQMRGIPEETRKSTCSKWAVLCFLHVQYHARAGVHSVWVMASWLLVGEQISARL